MRAFLGCWFTKYIELWIASAAIQLAAIDVVLLPSTNYQFFRSHDYIFIFYQYCFLERDDILKKETSSTQELRAKDFDNED